MEMKHFITSFLKGYRMDLENYRAIHLLSSFLKIKTKLIHEKLKDIINISDVQQGFRTGRSCIDAVFCSKTEQTILRI